MKIAKIIIGQIDSSLTRQLKEPIAAGEFQVEMVERGDRLLEILKHEHSPDLIVLQEGLSSPDALDVARSIQSNPGLSNVPILYIATHASADEEQQALQAGVDDFLLEGFSSATLLTRIRALLRLKFVADGKDDAEAVLYTLARTIEAKDPYTLGHADRVAQYAVQLGRAMGVSAAESEILRKGGMLHDIGKLAIPDAILLKPGRLTPEEFDTMKKHPILGCDICEKLRTVRDALPLIRHHHERLDGTGYPDGLRGEKVPSLVRIVTVVDIYDALRSQRSYKEAFSLDKSIQILWEEADKGWWDKNVLTAWERLVRSSSHRSASSAA